MSDVARVAGVSHQTVSRVLNDHPSVRGETRRRVLDAIAATGYRRNTAARALVTRRTGTIGVVTSGSALFGPTSTLIAIENAARDAGRFVSVVTVARWEAEAMRRALEHFLDQGVDGVVVVAGHDDAVDAVRRFPSPVPVVMVGPSGSGSGSGSGSEPEPGSEPGQEPGPGPRTVAVDQYAGARAAVRHLLDLGHRHVTHVAGPPHWLDARRRVSGWRDELRAAGIEPGSTLQADWSADSGYQAGRRLVADGLPTAVFAANDQLALGLLHAFAEAGVRVPGDVSVVGFDDVDGAAHFVPPLTTVRQGFRELGERCLRMLLDLIDGGEAHADTVQPELVVRESTGPPRG
jgi:DNA-binding LacI/PurR family transcriptional regulator